MSERVKSDSIDLQKKYGKKRRFGIDPYIIFDTVNDEIRMEIPWDILFDPEKNKKLREEIK